MIPFSLCLSLGHIGARTETSKSREQLGLHRTHSLAEKVAVEDARQEGWRVGLNHLRDEAAESLWVLEICRRVDETTRDISEVNTGEAVDGTGVAAHLAVAGVGNTLLSGGGKNVGESPWVLLGSLVPIVGDALRAKGVLESSVGISSVPKELHKHLLGQETPRLLCGVVGEQHIGKHVCTKGEGNTRVHGSEVVGIVGDAVFLAVGRVLRHYTCCDQAVAHLVCEIEEFLHELWV